MTTPADLLAFADRVLAGKMRPAYEVQADALALAAFVRELLGQADPGRWAWLDGKSIHIEGAYAVNPTGALRLAADLIRATAEAGKGTP